MLADMAFLENGIFCSAAEYERDKERRILQGSLREQDIYSMVLRLDSAKREAAKLAIRLNAQDENILKGVFLDAKLEPVVEFERAMNDGIITATGLQIRDVAGGGDILPATQAFLKDYFEDQFGGILEKSRGLSVGV